jgi:glycyl-tRNA synthetase beta subunit
MLECYEEALRLCNRTYGHRHETAARIHLNLALLYDCQLEKPAVALSHYKRWLLVNEQVLGQDHPKSIQARDAVVRHLRQMGKEKDAERFRQKGVC